MVESRVLYPVMPHEKVRIDASFLDDRYPEWRLDLGLSPDEHPGIDINLQGTSGNQDEGYPVVSIADGIVRHAGFHRVWGNIVLIEHPTLAKELGYKYLASQYAHLRFTTVQEGQYIASGEPLGSIGRGDPARPFYAHLHFEIRVSELSADHWPGSDRSFIRRNYLDPERFLMENYQPSRRGLRRLFLYDYDENGRRRYYYWPKAVVNWNYLDKVYARRLTYKRRMEY